MVFLNNSNSATFAQSLKSVKHCKQNKEKVRMKRNDYVRKILLIGILILIVSGLSAQIVVKGQVIDKENGEPMPFATVVEKGTTNGVATNNEGLFELTVSSPTSLLTVSTLGYQTQEVKVAANKTLHIILEPDLLHLEEVVVTALGISREKKALSYSVQDIKGEELNKSKQTNAMTFIREGSRSASHHIRGGIRWFEPGIGARCKLFARKQSTALRNRRYSD